MAKTASARKRGGAIPAIQAVVRDQRGKPLTTVTLSYATKHSSFPDPKPRSPSRRLAGNQGKEHREFKKRELGNRETRVVPGLWICQGQASVSTDHSLADLVSATEHLLLRIHSSRTCHRGHICA